MKHAAFGLVDFAKGDVSYRNNVVHLKHAVEARSNGGAVNSYITAYRFPEEYREHCKATGSVQHYAGPAYSDFLHWDVDRDGNLHAAILAARGLVAYLLDRFEVRPDQVRYFFSGSKGFHILLPSVLFGDVEPSPLLPAIWKSMALATATEAGVEVDRKVYDVNRLFRLPDTRHTSRLWKVELTWDELLNLGSEEIRALAKAPRGSLFKPHDLEPIDALAEFYSAHAAAIEREAVRPRTGPLRVGGSGAASELAAALSVGFTKGQRHALVLAFAGYAAKRNLPRETALGVAELLLEGEPDVEDPDNLPTAINDTYDRVREGLQVKGYSELRDLLDAEALAEVSRLLGDTRVEKRQAGDPSFAVNSQDNSQEKPENTASFALFASFAPETPEPLADAAFHGIAGEFVRTVEPHSEADPVALLGSFLVGVGNLLGPNAYLRVEGDRHYPRINATLVGDTAKGRKGTSWGQTRRLLKQVDTDWADGQIVEGLSSGEGLIHHVRDPIGENDPGVPDKRLLVTESELARSLKAIQRDGNTLSAVVRSAWDTGNLQTLTKNNPSKATGAHISILGHITRDELLRDLTATEVANGFANRFIWLYVKRSQELPFGGSLRDEDLAGLAAQVRDAVQFAHTAGEVRWHPDTRPLWVSVYSALSEGKPGMVGALLGRAEAQVVRIACLYALLDCDAQIRPEHLRAALAVWQYAEDSVRYIFRTTSGNPTADEILSLLKDAPEGVNRTEINAHFGRHKSASELNAAFELLHREGLAMVEKIPTAGRPREVWKAVPAKEANKAKEGTNTGDSAAKEVRNNRERRVA